MKERRIDLVTKELSGLLPLLKQKLIKPSEQIVKSKITMMQFHAMSALEEKRDLTMTELSRNLLTSKQQMTPMIDKLVDHGFVERKNNEVDRRVVKITLSPSGKKFLEKQKMKMTDMLKNKIQSLSDEDLNSLYKAFLEIKRIINKLI